MDHHLIIGGCGFLGRHVALALAQSGRTVTLADRARPVVTYPKEIASFVSWQQFEVGSSDWDRLLSNVDVVHYYAWSSIPATANANPGGDCVANVLPLIAMLEALVRRGDGRVVFTSSGGTVYGRVQSTPIQEDHQTLPITAYGSGKAAAELYLNLFRSLHQLDCRIARIANPYGAGQDLARGQGAVTTFLYKALRRDEIEIWGDGSVVRDYIHISDAVRALVALATAPLLTDSTFNVGSGCATSLNEIVAEIEAQLGYTLSVKRIAARSFDIPVNVLSIERAATQLGWSPRYSLKEGIALTLSDLSRGAELSTA